MKNEVWKDIEGYEGLYQVSNLGMVKSVERMVWSEYNKCFRLLKEKYLRPETVCGYLRVVLCKNGKTSKYLLHRLVAQSFIPNPNNLPQINHKDECKTNNTVENLEWCDARYNINYGTRNKKLRKPVICIELNKVFDSLKEAYRKTGYDYNGISKCCKGIQKTCGGYHWKYID